jgi:hypothetical protein
VYKERTEKFSLLFFMVDATVQYAELRRLSWLLAYSSNPLIFTIKVMILPQISFRYTEPGQKIIIVLPVYFLTLPVCHSSLASQGFRFDTQHAEEWAN